MKKITQVLFIFFALAGFAKAQTTVTDFDGNIYQTVKIGNQVWMSENLKSIHYADGTPLVDGTGVGDITGNYTTKYYFWYDDDSVTYADTYGALYTWAAVMNGAASSNNNPSGVQGVCPDGWHLPSDTAWKELEMYLGMSQTDVDDTGWRGTDEGGKLKEAGTTHWCSPNTGATNSSGFTALPGGYRYFNGNYNNIDSSAYFWSSAEYNSEYSRYRLLGYIRSEVDRGSNNKGLGLSVRCVKTSNLYTDSLALVALYDSTNGDGWTNRSNWLLGNVTDWYGITVSGDRVTEINLYNNNLTGIIPSEIGNLTSLNDLRLHVNQLSGSVPAEIGSLTNLNQLFLYNNQLTGSIPNEIGNLTNLTYLYLNSNQLSGSIPSEISNLTSLQIFDLNNNQFTDLPDLSAISTISELNIYTNQFTFKDIEPNINVASTTFTYSPQDSVGEIIDTTVYIGTDFTLSVSTGGASSQYQWKKDGTNIGTVSGDSTYTINPVVFADSGAYTCEITNTVALDLTLYSRPVNVFVDYTPFQNDSLALVALYDSTNGDGWTDRSNWLLGNVTDWYGVTVSGDRVTQIDLNTNNLVGIIPSVIGNLTSLTYLRLGANQLSGSIPTEIGNLTNLESLYLYDNQLSGSIPTEIGNLANLTFLNLYDNNLSGSFPPEIGNLTSLTGLVLSSTQLTGSIPSEIGNLSNLVELYLSDNLFSGSIPAEITNLTQLQNLYFSYNQFTDLPNLSSLVSLNDLQIHNNQFTFKDIEPNIGVASTYTYSPQDNVGEIIDTTVYAGTSYTMSVSTGGTNSQYQWKKDGTNIGALSGDSTYTFNPVAFSDSGTYTCEITNIVATELTLYSRPVNVTVEVKLCDMISNWEDITPPWESSAPGTFIVDTVVNPDKIGINPSDSCAKLITTTDNNEYIWYDLPGAETWNFSTYPVYKLMVNSPTEGDIVLRFENPYGVHIERQAHYSNPALWEELIFDFTGVTINGLTKMVVYPDYGGTTEGNVWYIDEIIHCDLQLNAGIIDLLIPDPGCELTNNELVTVQITNFGLDTISNFDVSYQIDNGTVITETVTNIIDPGDTLTYTFSTNADLYTIDFYKKYFFTANTMLTGDEGPDNDQYTETIGVYGNYTDREGWTTYGICDGMAGDGGTTGVVEDGSGNIWVGTQSGVSVYNGTSWISYDTVNSPLTSNSIETMYADNSGNVWIGTWKDEGGVCKYDGSAWNIYTTENSGIAGNVVEEVIEDSYGNYWFSTYNGISKYDGTTVWTTYDTGNSGLVDDYTNAITEDSNGNIWIGTNYGVSKFDVAGDTWTTYNTDNSGLENNYIYAISEDLQGNIWFGTYGGGVTKFDGTTWTTYRVSNSDFPDDRVFSIMADSNGNVWFGTFGSGAVKYDGTTWIIYNEENGLVTRSNNTGGIFFWGDIFEDSNANIWFPAYNGLAKKAPVNIEIYNIEYSYSTCNGTNDGTITIYALAENPPLQYSIDGGTTYQSDSVFISLAPGTYPIAVTDGVDTVSTDTVILLDFENISTYPYIENFDSYALNSTEFNYGWHNETTNNLDWMVYSGSTPTSNTGPVSDQSGSGNYLYLEASAHYFYQGSLISSCFDISGISNPTLKFYYHMSGTSMGELAVDIYSGGAWINNLMFASGDQGTDWLQYSTDLSPYGSIIKFRFRGIIGDTYHSDIAIDKIEVTGLRNENEILTYSFAEQTGAATIDDVNHTVAIEVALGTDVTGLVATFTISDLANITISTTSQVSGVTSNNFTSFVTYTVTAEDGTTQDWVVTVTVATSLSSENDILSFSFTEQTGAATIDAITHRIDIEVVNGTDLSNLVASFTIFNLATIEISSTTQVNSVTSNNFTNPVTYTVTAEDGTAQDWIITVSEASITVISDFPYSEDFESGNGGWRAGGVNSSWEHGIPSAGQTINSAASGNNAWVTNLTGDYNQDEVSYVTSPQFDLSSLNFPKIEFNIWWYAEGFYDGANFQYKPGSGAWKTLGIDEGDDSWYNSSYLYSIEKGFGFDMNESAGWSGDDEWGYGSNGWVTVDHALTGIDYQSANVTFRIAFASNSSYENDGVAIDNINIFSDPTGIDPVETGLSDIQIYPNPNEGKFRLVYNGERDVDLNLQLINLQGQVIMSEQIKTGYRYSKEFELDYLAPGIYYFRLMHKQGVVVKKMVVR